MKERVGACAGREHEGVVLQELGRADGAEVGLLVIGQRIVPELLKPEVVEFDATRGSIEARSTIRPHETLLVLVVLVLALQAHLLAQLLERAALAKAQELQQIIVAVEFLEALGIQALAQM